MKRFNLTHLLVLLTLVAVILIVVAPTIRKSKQVLKIRKMVFEELDHQLIRDSARQLLDLEGTQQHGITIVDQDKLPPAIRQTSPQQVWIHKQVLTIQYAAGVSLVVVQPGMEVPRGKQLEEGIGYFESSDH